MEKIELNKGKSFYMLGIGGISMSALAIFLKEKGNFVAGSDTNESDAVKMLQSFDVEVDLKFNAKEIDKADYVVFTSAIKESDKNFLYAKSKSKKIICRGELLGAISKQYDKVVAVAGSHGKTTTTAMIYQILKYAKRNPSLHLGGFRCEDMRNFHIGSSEIFVTEACEYHDNFLYLKPYVSVITNVEKEHMDYFKTFENQLLSFEKFRANSKFVVEADKTFEAKNLRHKKNGNLSFDLYENKQKLMRLNLQICEDVNVLNCIYAYRVCKLLGISDEEIKLGLESFKGVKTRFERVKCQDFLDVVCDYSHHPTEIEKAISSARKIFRNRRLVVVFQPHTFSRTKDLLSDFVEVLKGVDAVVLYKTYSAREKPDDGVSAYQLSLILKKENPNVSYADDFESLKNLLKGFEKESVLMFVGAGDLPAVLHKNNFLS